MPTDPWDEKPIWDHIVEGRCPFDHYKFGIDDTRCPEDCPYSEEGCGEYQRIKEVKYRRGGT